MAPARPMTSPLVRAVSHMGRGGGRDGPAPEGWPRLARGHPYGPVQADDLAADQVVLHDVPDERRVLLGPAQTRRERDLVAERLPGLFGQARHHRGVEEAGGE